MGKSRSTLAFVLLLTFLLSACGASAPQPSPTPVPSPTLLALTPTVVPTPQPSPTPQPMATPDYVSTLVALGPMIEITFDGTECKVSGPTEVPAGTQVFKFTNLTGQIAVPWVHRNYPGKTWQDVLDAIGNPPGSQVPDNWNWIALQVAKRSVSAGLQDKYYQYDLNLVAEYHIVVEYPTLHMWPCAPFFVVAAP